MELAIAMIVAYVPFIYGMLREILDEQKPKKRIYDTSKTNDYWLR
jgi:hypothetical protein